MTSRPPDRPEREPLGTLRSVRGIQPNEQAVHRAVQRALAAAERVSSQPRRVTWKGIIMRSGLAAAVLVIIVAASWLGMSGTDALAAPTWADLARQTSGIDQVHIAARVYKGRELMQRADFWVKSPGIIRSHTFELLDGKMVPTGFSIATPSAAVRWDERTRLGERTSTDNVYMTQSSAASTFEAVLGVSLIANRPEASITINGEQVAFAPVEEKHPEKPGLRGFRLVGKNSVEAVLPPPFTSMVYWFAERSNTLLRLTISMGEGEGAQRQDMAVDFDPDIPPGWFDVALPAHCVDVAAGVAPRLSPDVRKVYDQVAAARKRFGDFRAVIWRDRTGGWPSFREATHGPQWRCDNIDWTDMHSAMLQGNPQGYVKITPQDPFAKLWAQVNRPDYGLSLTALTWRDALAVVIHGQRAAQIQRAIKDGYETSLAPSLHMTAWPEWMWWENLNPHGWDLSTPPLTWRLGPPDPDQPEQVQAIGERPRGHYTAIRYTFDRSKDWVCVGQEWEINPTDKRTWEVTAFGRTAEGLWYPSKATILGSRYEYAVERGPADPAFFEYPKGMPEPVDAFAEAMKQALATATAPAPATAPAENTPRTVGSK